MSARATFTYFNSQCTYVTAPAGNLELFGAPKFLAIIDELAIPQMPGASVANLVVIDPDVSGTVRPEVDYTITENDSLFLWLLNSL